MKEPRGKKRRIASADSRMPEPHDDVSGESVRRKAVALRYDAENDAAPRVIAKGAGLLADRILALAEEHRIHVHKDPNLTGLLAKLEINAPIPEDLYRAVAEVLAFVYRLDRRMEEKMRTGAR